MKIVWKDLTINNKKIKALITINEKRDRNLLKELYIDWKKLNL